MTNTLAPPRVNVARGIVLALVVVSLISALAVTFFAARLTIDAPLEDHYDVTYDCLLDLGYRGVWDGAERLVGVTKFDQLYCRLVG